MKTKRKLATLAATAVIALGGIAIAPSASANVPAPRFNCHLSTFHSGRTYGARSGVADCWVRAQAQFRPPGASAGATQTTDWSGWHRSQVTEHVQYGGVVVHVNGQASPGA